MRESDIEKYLVKRVKELGGEVRKVKWVGREGAPDRLVMLGLEKAADRLRYLLVWHANGGEVDLTVAVQELVGLVGVWPELKAPGKAATFPANAHERKQHREHKRLRKMGQRVEVVDSFARIDELLGV